MYRKAYPSGVKMYRKVYPSGVRPFLERYGKAYPFWVNPGMNACERISATGREPRTLGPSLKGMGRPTPLGLVRGGSTLLLFITKR